MGTPKTATFEAILIEHFALVRCALWRKHGIPWHDLSDVEQEVWCTAIRQFDPKLEGDPAVSLPGWLLRLCERQAESYYRAEDRRRREVPHSHEALDVIDGGTPGLDEELACGERCALLLKLVNGLSPERRAVVIAHDLEGIAMLDVAARLQIPVATAWNRHRCGLDDLRASARKKRDR